MSTVGKLAKLTKVEHALFALPFAGASMLYAARGLPSSRTFLLALVALVAGRSLGMACNRLVDRRVDAQNPRTQDRLLPRGELGVTQVKLFALACVAVLGAASWALNPLCFQLLPVAVVALVGYSYAKFFTPACHLILGSTHACAIGGAWLAVTGQLEPAVWPLAFGVALWTAGFDVIYACQDIEVDRRLGLHSIPAALGRSAAMDAAALCHCLALALLLAFGWVYGVGPVFYRGMALVTLALGLEHLWARGEDDAALQRAFFQANVAVSSTFLITAGIEVLAR